MTKYKSKALFYFIFSNALKKDRTNRIHAKGIPAESSSPATRCRTAKFPQNDAAETFKIASCRKKYYCRPQTRNSQSDSFNSDKNSQIERKDDKPPNLLFSIKESPHIKIFESRLQLANTDAIFRINRDGLQSVIANLWYGKK